MGDFFSFRKMITPFIIKIFYVLGAVAILVISFYYGVEEENVGLALLMFVGGELLWRLLNESIILFFSIHEMMKDTREYARLTAVNSADIRDTASAHGHNPAHRPNPVHNPNPAHRPNPVHNPNPAYGANPAHNPNPAYAPDSAPASPYASDSAEKDVVVCPVCGMQYEDVVFCPECGQKTVPQSTLSE